MGYIDPETCCLRVNAVRNEYRIGEVAEIFGVCRKTVWKWSKRTRKVDRPGYRGMSKQRHKTHRKVIEATKVAIVVLREV